MDDAHVLTVEERGSVRLVRLNRPESLNAANPELHTRLTTIWQELAADESCGAVVITGAGRAFCAGGDMDVLARMNEDEGFRRGTLAEARRIVHEMVAFPIPLIAAVNGPAVGLGCSLAGLSDVVIMDETAYLADPHVSVGLVAADGGALTWPLMTSLLRAKEYLFTGDRIPAPVAVELGLANRAVADGTCVDEAIALAERMAAQPRQALRETKRALNKGLERSVMEVLDFAIAAETLSIVSYEHRALVEKIRSRRKA